MKQMKNIGALAILLLCLASAGCITTSIHPIYERTQLLKMDNLEGEWVSTRSIWTIKQDVAGAYLLSYKECEDPINEPMQYTSCTIADFRLNVIRLQGQLYADFKPISYMNSENQFLMHHVKALHSFAKMEIDDESLTFSFMDNQWLHDYVTKQNGRIGHVISERDVILTASTPGLQKFLIAQSNNEDAYTENMLLHRKIVH